MLKKPLMHVNILQIWTDLDLNTIKSWVIFHMTDRGNRCQKLWNIAMTIGVLPEWQKIWERKRTICVSIKGHIFIKMFLIQPQNL
ncbi:hypothetical protein ES703_65186 [subsurface metagenome]